MYYFVFERSRLTLHAKHSKLRVLYRAYCELRPYTGCGRFYVFSFFFFFLAVPYSLLNVDHHVGNSVFITEWWTRGWRVLNSFLRSSAVQDIWAGLPRFLLPIILPWIIARSRLYSSRRRITCPKCSFYGFYYFEILTRSFKYTADTRRVSTRLIFNILRYTRISNARTRVTG